MPTDPLRGPLDKNGKPLTGALLQNWRRRQEGGSWSPRVSGGGGAKTGRSGSADRAGGEPPLVDEGKPRLPWDTNDSRKRMKETEALLAQMGITPAKTAESFYGLHQMLAIMVREPALAVQPQEAQLVGEQLYRVIVLYDLVWLLKYMPIMMLVSSVGIVEGNTIRRVRAARAARRGPERARPAPPSMQEAAPSGAEPGGPAGEDGWAPPTESDNGHATAEASRSILHMPGVDATGEPLGEVLD